MAVALAALLLVACGKSKQVTNVEEMIDAIGTVTLESGDTLEQITEAFNALSEKEKDSVENYTDFVKARTRYEKLVEEKNSIVGTWELSDGVGEEGQSTVELLKAFGMNMYFTFNKDGTGSMDITYGGETESESFRYTYENGVLKVDEGDEEGVNIKIEGDKLYLESEGMQMIFKKK